MAEVTRSTRSLRETLAAFDARVSPLEQVAPPRGANVGVNGVAVDATRRAAWTTPTWVEAKPELVDWNTTDVYNWCADGAFFPSRPPYQAGLCALRVLYRPQSTS